MADIAAHLGVSRQLVSIVLRDVPGASTETRRRVLEAAERLGYSPHMGAITLRQTRSRHLGVAFTPAHATEPDIIEAIYPAAEDRGYQVVLSAQTATRNTSQAVRELLGYRCAAIIVISPDLSGAALRGLAKRVTVPLVVVGAGKQNKAFDVVRSAGDAGIRLAVQHLIDLGHRDISYVDSVAMPPAALRLAGYLAAIEAAGLKSDVLKVPGPDYTEESGSTAARRLLERPELPTAVAAGNDQEAVGLITVVTRAGIAVPEDISVTGFDDSRFARLSSIDLTTARQDPAQMGQAAVTAAVRRIDQPTVQPRLHVIEPTLVMRSSSAPSRVPRATSRLPRTRQSLSASMSGHLPK
jgi:DNA-binding LacI/PurR family transcriptional regulator